MAGYPAVRPRPAEASPFTEPFWAATGRGEFLIQRCGACQNAQHYGRYNCIRCGSTDLSWEQASGRGTVYTFTVARRPTHPKMAGLVPYVLAIVELAEGPHVTTNLVDVEPEAVQVGMPVEVCFEDAVDGVAIPLFRPTG
ncbi:MAG: Zn-ribbon domain-containing OB-fold protein [Acidimicrobiales bacterium]